MSTGLHLSQRMTMSQILAPQLQQSLALLQAPTLELRAMVEQELQVNPVLEDVSAAELSQSEKEEGVTAEEGDFTESLDLPQSAEPSASDPAVESGAADAASQGVDDWQAEFERLAQVDQDWRDHFSESGGATRASSEDQEKRQFMFDSLTAQTSLQADMMEQLRLSDLSPEMHSIAEMIIGNMDDYGYLKASMSELSFSTNIPVEQILEVLAVIQKFDPPGVGARDLRECLMLQLERANRQETLEYIIIRDHFEALGRRRLPEMSKALGKPLGEIQQALDRIAHLEPRPGREFLPDNHSYIVPEVFVKKEGDEFVVTNNSDHVPHLRISNNYKDLMAKAESSHEVKEYIRDKIRAGKFFIKSIHQRQQTILNIAKEIVNRQRDFLENGVSHLKPMTMVEVAEVVGVHETTVSRAVSGKYMETPLGVFEMKYFFTSGIQTTGGSTVSNTSVKELIDGLVKAESTRHPLSDEEIVKTLKNQGIMIARRTVAKYRSELNILPSHLRRSY